jgi:hypothetical protein
VGGTLTPAEPFKSDPIVPARTMTATPASIGSSSAAAAAAWVPTLASLTLLAVWHAVWRQSRRLASFIVLPNLAPPG